MYAVLFRMFRHSLRCALIATLSILFAFPVSAQNDLKVEDLQKINELEAKLKNNPDNHNFENLNQLRHLYSSRDERRSFYYCDEIFKISTMDGYTLAVLADWKFDEDPRGAAFALEMKSGKYPEFNFVRAACIIKQGEIFSRLGEKSLARSKFEAAMNLSADGLQTYKAVAGAMMKNIDLKTSCAPWKIPVLEIRYFPLTADKKMLDIAVTTNVEMPLPDIRKKCDDLTKDIMRSLEEGSRFRAYKNPDAKPSLKYEIVGTIEYLEPFPFDSKKKFPDYKKILERANAKDYVENKGVKEIWIWGYHSPVSGLWESNLASPYGDISNSDRDPNDLPIFSTTYTVYHYNYERSTSEAIENHMHQIEGLIWYFSNDLWERFAGKSGKLRCGNCHYPPNGKIDYDWTNKTYVETDIEDWRPEEQGEMKKINCDRWDADSLKWFIYWMQSLPGENNNLKYKGKTLTNWWVIVGDYDAAVNDRDAMAK